MLEKEKISAAVGRAPVLAAFLRRYAKRAYEGKDIPEAFSAGGFDYDAQLELERLIGAPVRRNAAGSLAGRFPPRLREPEAWKEAVLFFGFGAEGAGVENGETFFMRLAWRVPGEKAALDSLAAMPEVSRYLAKEERRPAWRDLFIGAADYLRGGAGGPVTLSELGSRLLNDSKALRAGPLRRQLSFILEALTGRDGDERTLFATCGIFENPYTSHVTFFAPLSFTTDDGESYDYPARLFAAGLAAVIPGETAARIRSIRWEGSVEAEIVTSENAAPFAKYVASGIPSLYTEGYPNYAVQTFLRRLAEGGLCAVHAGDADLDGFRIAGMVRSLIPVRRVIASEVVREPGAIPGIALTEEQKARIRAFSGRFPEDDFAEEASLLLARGFWYEQEQFPVEPGKRR